MKIDDTLDNVMKLSKTLYSKNGNKNENELDLHKVMDYIDELYKRVFLIESNLKKINELLDNDLR